MRSSPLYSRLPGSSMAVESQLPHLDPDIVSENMCVLYSSMPI
jgi:hypothetical protein